MQITGNGGLREVLYIEQLQKLLFFLVQTAYKAG